MVAVPPLVTSRAPPAVTVPASDTSPAALYSAAAAVVIALPALVADRLSRAVEPAARSVLIVPVARLPVEAVSVMSPDPARPVMVFTLISPACRSSVPLITALLLTVIVLRLFPARLAVARTVLAPASMTRSSFRLREPVPPRLMSPPLLVIDRLPCDASRARADRSSAAAPVCVRLMLPVAAAPVTRL